ncbi:MAG: class I SAM-dependent methyltransferase [Gammaproteobacteria bacterium]|nr:class I SAM-dependent methyltransferase [Gammaproteobacteria bacterium]
MTTDTDKLHQAYQAKNPKETSEVYDDWAAEYEQHMKNVGFTHPAMVASMAARHVQPTEARVLDAGAGTGILGEILPALGYPNIVGLDASAGMLEIANSRNNYQELTQQYLGEPLTFDNNEFTLVASSGVFTQGHAPLDGLDELIRITKPGGHLVFSIARTYLEGLFNEKRKQLEQQNKWRFVDASQRYNSTPLDDTLIAQVFVFEVV